MKEKLVLIAIGGNSLLNSGYHVVAVGGSGIPVVRTDKGL